MQQEKKYNKILHVLSYGLVFICAILFILCMVFFAYGQYCTNQSILAAGDAIFDAIKSANSSQGQIDYTGAITYLEATQQAYSENSMVRLTSIIYVLASTIILGYGAKMLRIGKDDKDELIKTLYDQTTKQLNENAVEYKATIDTLYKDAENQLNLYASKHQEAIEKAKEQVLKDFDCGAILLNSSGNALHLCLLLQSCLEIIPLFTDEQQRNKHLNTLQRIEIEMIHSLQLFLEYMEFLSESDSTLNGNIQDMISRNLILLRRSFSMLSSTEKPKQINDDRTIARLLSKCEYLCKR